MRPTRKIIPQIILEELERTGLPWRLQLGSKHHHLFVADKLIGILPRGRQSESDGERRCALNTRAQIRRLKKQIQAAGKVTVS